jgi:hypothetical protein
MDTYWFDDLINDQSWTSLWHNYIICGDCGGIRRDEGACPVCNREIPSQKVVKIISQDGKQFDVPANAFMGAEGRYEDYVDIPLYSTPRFHRKGRQ